MIAALTVRAATLADIPAMAEVHVRCWHETYAGLIPNEHLGRRTVAYRTAQWNEALRDRDQVVFVACESSGDIVGFASGGPSSEPVEGFDAELGALYVLAAAHHRGAGRQLVHAIGGELKSRGFHAAWVRVLTENPAVEFYKKTGAEFICDVEEDIDGCMYREQFYGWRDVAAM
ncbi:MAG TPA: GNAT family N-acetyltransferase [Candidatus Rubrimentiphilum sp.]|nr:GNAT family N-acetyltransferase [Candidatus Rubrimentiphilum sp.]